jgi:hypothetical protein
VTYPVYGSARDKKTKQLTTKVPVGFTTAASQYGQAVVDLVGDPDFIVTFRAYELLEEKAQTKTETIELPPEEYIRPGWYGDCWHSSNISSVYYDFFDIGAITEPQQIQNTNGDIRSGGVFTSSEASQTVSDFASRKDDPLQFATDQLLALTPTKDSSIQQAVDYLVLTYSIIRNGGFDTEQFIRSYTWRPIATMLDIFGTSDLQLSEDGTSVVTGVEGFHSRAFGPYEDLFGLVTSDIESIVGIKRGSSQSQRADTRKRKHQAVINYIAQLRLSRAILG